MGSAPIAHAAVKTSEPVREATVAMLGTFIDTIIICTRMALLILVTDANSGEHNGGALTAHAFRKGLFVVFITVGVVGGLKMVWNIADIFNALRSIPNLIGLLLLSGVVARETKKYCRQL